MQRLTGQIEILDPITPEEGVRIVFEDGEVDQIHRAAHIYDLHVILCR